MDIPYPWNVATGVTCFVLLSWFFCWIQRNQVKLARAHRAFAERHGYRYRSRAEETPPVPLPGRHRAAHTFTGTLGGHDVTITEHHHHHPTRYATVVTAIDLAEATPPDESRLPADGTARYRVANGRLMLIRPHHTIDHDQVLSDGRRLAALLDEPARSR